MNIFNYTLKSNPFPENEYMQQILKDDFCFLDIETTGFSRKNDQVVIIGLLFREGGKYTLRQYFLEDSLQEKKLLKQFISDLSDFQLMVTYNGLSFDYPFIQERAKFHQLPLRLSNLRHIDLYKHIQGNKGSLPIENYQLKTVEKLLGIHREDVISGGDSVNLYYKYLQNRDRNLREQILLHNYEDILYLPMITEIFTYIPKTPFLINSLHHSMAIPCTENFKQELTFVFKLTDLRLRDHKLSIKGVTKTLGNFNEINIFEEQFSFFWSPETEQYHLELLVLSEVLSPDILVHYFNYEKLFTSTNVTLPDSPESFSGQVDNNIIMYTNNILNYPSALQNIPKILKKLYGLYLCKKY